MFGNDFINNELFDFSLSSLLLLLPLLCYYGYLGMPALE